MEKQNYIGRKVNGFSFADGVHSLLSWNPEMDKHVGEIGTIYFYHEYGKCYSVKFQNGQWNYPASLIDQYIVPEEQDETELRDQFAMQAMNGILSAQSEMRSIGNSYNTAEQARYLAEESYLIADAMLKSRKEVKGGNVKFK